MIFADATAVNVALPALERDLHAGPAGAAWVVEAYALTLSALILLGGALGDIFGRRGVYGIGIALFAVASAACAAAPNLGVLIAARCVQGVGGALATPGSLALISAAFDGPARGRAIGTWSAFSVIVSAAGPIVGGWLVQSFSWRWIFLINLPLAAIVLGVLVTRVGESRDPSVARRVDVGGAALATGGLGALVFGLIRCAGSKPGMLGAFALAAGLLLLAGFVAVERRSAAPMLQFALFRSRPFMIANLFTFLVYAALGGSLYFVPFDLIDVQGYTPAAAGAALVPTTLLLFGLSRFAGGLVDRFGARPLLAGGALAAAFGFALFATVGVGRAYWQTIFPGAMLLGIGAAAFVAPLTTLVMGSVDDRHAGVASGINNAVSRVAGVFAIAALTIVQTAAAGASVDRALASPAIAPSTRALVAPQRDRILGGAAPDGIVDRAQCARVVRIVRAGYATGFALVMSIAACLSVLAAAVALDGALRRPPRPTAASGVPGNARQGAQNAGTLGGQQE